MHGDIVAKVFSGISSADLPDGKMYYNIAKRTIEPVMQEAYEKIANMGVATQTVLNQNAHIGIKAIKPELNQDRIDGILNRVSTEDVFDDIKWILNEPVKVFAISIIDDAVNRNADFHYRAGMDPRIIRKATGKCCKWCREVAGTYVYPDVPKDVFRRHDNCRCVVEYFPGDGKRQNIWSKQWSNVSESDKIEQRKDIGLNEDDDIIIRKIKNEIIPKQNIKEISSRQEIHRQGTKAYNNRVNELRNKNQYGPSKVTITDDEILELVKQYSGSGKIKYNKAGEWDNKECIIDNDKIIGVVVNNINGNSAGTSVFKIHYAKNGVHIVPDYPSKKR